MEVNKIISRIMRIRSIVILAIIFFSLIVSSSMILTSYGDDIAILFISWLEGKPKALIRFNIDIPKTVDGDYCFIAIHRFSTPYNPTPRGYSLPIYRGKVPCGLSIVVKDMINMFQVGVERDEKTGKLKPIYNSPEYVIIITSVKGYSFMKFIQVRVERPITDVSIHVIFKKYSTSSQSLHSKLSLSSIHLQSVVEEICDVTITYRTNTEFEGYCVAKTKLTYLNSIPGLQVAFGIVGGTSASVMYLESWGASCLSDNPDDPCPESTWSSAGKKRTISVVSEETDYIANGSRAIVWGSIRYNYEHWAVWNDDFKTYFKYDIFYPIEIGGLHTPQIIGTYQQPSTPPNYAYGPLKGDRKIWFTRNVYISDTKLSLSTSISVTITIYDFSVTVSISLYKAGESNNLYTTPYIHVIDISGKDYDWYYWWYKNDNPMTYEVEFYGR